MKRCKVCGSGYRSGRIAFIMAEGGLKGARVCQGCASNGVLLVAARPQVKQAAPRGPRAPDEVIKTLRAQVKGLKATGSGEVQGSPEDNFYQGRIEGLENAIDALTRAAS